MNDRPVLGTRCMLRRPVDGPTAAVQNIAAAVILCLTASAPDFYGVSKAERTPLCGKGSFVCLVVTYARCFDCRYNTEVPV